MTPIDPSILVDNLFELHRTFHVGVPCSFLSGLLIASGAHPEITYVAATSEAEAVGIAAGAWLAGRKPLVMMQNSGFCDAINPLSSLAYPFRIPLLLFVSGRGAFGIDDEPQHELIGRRMMDLLAAAEIPATRIPWDADEISNLLHDTEALLERTSLPVALVVERGLIRSKPTRTLPQRTLPNSAKAPPNIDRIDLGGHVGQRTMSRIHAIDEVRRAFSDQAIFVATTGYTGRELYALGDNSNNIYLVGSMGCASAVGLGLALNTPETVVVFDGDGAALMRMGNLATIGQHQPTNFVHVILDNGAYESTGDQLSASAGVSFCSVARACGYQSAQRFSTLDQLRSASASFSDQAGPSLIHLDIRSGTLEHLPRPSISPRDVALRLQSRIRDRRTDDRRPSEAGSGETLSSTI
jgi:phosphonopyruvate decarboxylase